MSDFLHYLVREPPFRFFVQKLLKLVAPSVRTRATWDLSDRPHYLVGVLQAADSAKSAGVARIAVVEFGVAGGNGLLALQRISEDVEKATGVQITVYGFDSGSGLPEPCGDYRDHPDHWAEGDYAMDYSRLESHLTSRTKLILGDVKNTVPEFVDGQDAPLGFVAMDLDLYSSTRDALRILALPKKRMLRRTYMYFDDVSHHSSHRFAGELLAIDEFNEKEKDVKIDRWRNLGTGRPFFERSWIQKMYVAHDLRAISQFERAKREAKSLELRV